MTPEEYREQKPLHDAAVHSALRHLATKEARFAHERYGYYHSPHEGQALIEEEAMEAHTDLRQLESYVSELKLRVYDMPMSGTSPAKLAEAIRSGALNLAQEAVHVAATAMRFLEACEHDEGEWAEPGR